MADGAVHGGGPFGAGGAIYGWLSDEWQWARGTVLIEGGIDIATLDADALYSVGYALLMKRIALGKEINDAYDEVKAAMARQLRERETGMPSIMEMGFLPLNMDEFGGFDDLPPELTGGGDDG
jgi:hypothetical protein